MAKTLLLADDSVTIQKVVGISFANEDVTLVTVDNGDDAIARTRELRPDVILADVVMPGKSGYEVCEAVQDDPQLRHIPVLLLTGTFEAFDEDRARSAGAAGHITKPFESQALVDQVNELLRAASAPPPVESPESISDDEGHATDDAFDFLSDEPTESDALAAPDAEEGFDLASEDDAFSFASEAPAAVPVADRTVAILPDDAEAPSLEADEDPLGASETDDASASAFEFAFEGRAEDAPDPLASSTADDLGPAEIVAEDEAEPFDVAAEALEAPEPALPEETPEPAAEPILEHPPEPEAAPEPAPIEASAVAALPAELRDQVHETLEKIAWESFGEVADKIVRQAVERVEAVAWEVIPQMAEALIREEIRRIKGEDTSE